MYTKECFAKCKLSGKESTSLFWLERLLAGTEVGIQLWSPHLLWSKGVRVWTQGCLRDWLLHRVSWDCFSQLRKRPKSRATGLQLRDWHRIQWSSHSSHLRMGNPSRMAFPCFLLVSRHSLSSWQVIHFIIGSGRQHKWPEGGYLNLRR